MANNAASLLQEQFWAWPIQQMTKAKSAHYGARKKVHKLMREGMYWGIQFFMTFV